MNGGRRIIPLETAQADRSTGQEDDARVVSGDGNFERQPSIYAALDARDDDEVTLPSRSPAGIILSAIATVLIAAWTAFFVWANWAAMNSSPNAAQWSSWMAAWSTPVVLVVFVVMFGLRSGKREVARFGNVARVLTLESDRLERRLTTTNTELSLARDFISAQARDLEALGRVAVDRLTGTAKQLQDLIVGNGEQIDRISEVSGHALENMEKLRGQLPVLANSARDVTNSIGNAGRTAHVQLEDLIAGLQRLNEFGLASERQVNQVRDQVDEAIAAFEAGAKRLGEIAQQRFAALTSQCETQRERMDADESAALAAMRARSDLLGEALQLQHAALLTNGEEALTALHQRIEAFSRDISSNRSKVAASEDEALQALSARADLLAQQVANQREVLASAEEQTLAALEARFAGLRSENASLGQELAAHEEAALKAFAERTATELATLRQSVDQLGRDHEALLIKSDSRMIAFETSARALTRSLVEQAETIDSEIERRRGVIHSAMADQGLALKQRLADIDDAIGQTRQSMASLAAGAADDLARKLADLDNAMEEQRTRQLDEARILANHCDSIAERVGALTTILRTTAQSGEGAAAAIDQKVAQLTQRLVDMRSALDGTDGQISDVTTSAVRLLELIQAGGDHTRTQLPDALRQAEAGLGQIESRVTALRDSLLDASDSGKALSESVGSTREEMSGAFGDAARLHDDFNQRVAEQEARFSALRDVLAKAREESDALALDLDGSVSAAVARLSEAAAKAGLEVRESTSGEIEALAARLGEEANAAILRVLQGRGAEMVARLEQAIDSAATASRDTAIQMRDQLAKVDELAGNLENRVIRARERAEEQIDNDFARRTALITEALNSTAIDIAKVLSTDVSETAWASYLRGDRGIFTRRAVTLLDNSEARAVQQHYETDEEFRAHVNRYIHDFEAMLRQLLSTRDGNALGVTLLSSDMGKLYVALAQGIERLRS